MMKVPFVFLAIVSVVSAAICDVGRIRAGLSNVQVAKCDDDSGYNFFSLQMPVAPDVPKMCASEACLGMLKTIKAATPEDCYFGEISSMFEMYTMVNCSDAATVRSAIGNASANNTGRTTNETSIGSRSAAPHNSTSTSPPPPVSTSPAKQSSHDETKGFNMVLLVPIIGATVVIALVVIWFQRRNQNKTFKAATNTTTNGVQMSLPAKASPRVDYHAATDNQQSFAAAPARMPTSGPNEPYNSGKSRTNDHSSTMQNTVGSTYGSYGGNSRSVDKSFGVLERILMDDRVLMRSRIDMAEIQFVRTMSKGAYGEVWLCHARGMPVAVKRLLPHKHDSYKEIKDFISEIERTASLTHPHIIRYIGVAWTSMEDLCMALEFLPQGDMLSYLRQNNDMLSWVRDKLPMAVGIARAVEYLHARRPAIIHRDIKAKNVLLTEQFQTKLIDFGVSRDQVQETMTAGVGTPYWSAPEVLDGSRYTEKSDIYSFGVLLSEIDKADVPYQDLRSENGETAKTLQILNMIVAGKLRPTFSTDCPQRIVRVAHLCLEREPERRPSATQVVELLLGEASIHEFEAAE